MPGAPCRRAGALDLDRPYRELVHIVVADDELTEAELPGMAARLTLPDGWESKPKTLDQELTITTNGLANTVPDNLANM